MASNVKRGKKYAGQERWENDVRDIQRITSAPRVGKINGSEHSITIAGKAVKFDLVLLHDLLRRRESSTENDGLRGRSYDGGAPGGKSESTQTEAAALRGLPEKDRDKDGNLAFDDWTKHERHDPVGIQLEEAFGFLAQMAFAARKFESKVEVILNADSRAKEVQDRSSQCAACGTGISGVGEDRRRAGYGPCCYWRWLEWSRRMDDDGIDQSHVTFQIQRKAEIDALKLVDAESVTNA